MTVGEADNDHYIQLSYHEILLACDVDGLLNNYKTNVQSGSTTVTGGTLPAYTNSVLQSSNANCEY